MCTEDGGKVGEEKLRGHLAQEIKKKIMVWKLNHSCFVLCDIFHFLSGNMFPLAIKCCKSVSAKADVLVSVNVCQRCAGCPCFAASLCIFSLNEGFYTVDWPPGEIHAGAGWQELQQPPGRSRHGFAKHPVEEIPFKLKKYLLITYRSVLQWVIVNTITAGGEWLLTSLMMISLLM